MWLTDSKGDLQITELMPRARVVMPMVGESESVLEGWGYDGRHGSIVLCSRIRGVGISA